MYLVCQQFTFYNDGNLYTNKSRTTGKRQYEDIPELAELSIILFGTEEQVEETFQKYIKKHGLCLDECYDIKEEPEFLKDGRENFFYEGEEQNKKIKERLEICKQKYIENNCKTLFI